MAELKDDPEYTQHINRGVTVDAVIIKDSKLLLIKRGRDPFKDHWALPGGYVDWNETVEEAVAREVDEETGLKVISAKLIGVYSLPSRHPKQAINIAFVVIANGTPVAGDDAKEFNWYSLDSLPDNMAFDHLKIIADSQKN